MLKTKSIVTLKIFLIGCCICLLSVSIGHSQHDSSLFSWQHESFLHNTASLAMSNAALTHFINPAVGGRNNHLQFRSNLGSANPYSSDFYAEGYNPVLTNFGLSFTDQRFWVAFSFHDFNFTWFDEGTHRHQSFRLQSGYQLSQTLAVGFGVGINRWSLPARFHPTGGFPAQSRANMFFDAGLLYADSFSIGRVIIQPEAGVSLNNIGTYDTFELGGRDAFLPQAGQLRWSVGIDAITSDKWNERSWFGVNVYSGWNKYFARSTTPEDDKGSGFADLFTNWGSFESSRYPTGSISAFDQISFSLGAKFTVLEILSVQYGRLSGADLWVRSRQSWGIELEYSYFSLNMTGINYRSEARWDDNSSLLFYEVIVNLPLSIFKF